jgi:hypothetical protein
VFSAVVAVKRAVSAEAAVPVKRVPAVRRAAAKGAADLRADSHFMALN